MIKHLIGLSLGLACLIGLVNLTGASAPVWAEKAEVFAQPSQSGQVIITKEKPAPPKQIKQSLAQLPIKKGMTGPAISQLHTLLRLAGFVNTVFSPDDTFTETTETAVKRFQYGENDYLKKYLGWQNSDALSATGIVDKATADGLVRKTSGYELSCYIIKSGDTLGKISGQFNISAEKIADFNGFSLRHILQIGAKIWLPAAQKDPKSK